jgi:protein SCO1
MKRCSLLVILTLLFIVSSANSCRRNPTDAKRFELKGKVVSVEPEKQLVTIAHEEVKNYMPGMTMPFTLRDKDYLKEIQSGDDITATLVVDGSQSWLEDVVISRQSGEPVTTTGVTEAKEGDTLPDFFLINQDGKEIRLRDYQGKVLLLTFIYTRCPLPEYCTLMSTNFLTVDRQLQQRPDVYSKTHLLSITIDPEYDTPKVLRSYGAAHTEKYQSETFAHWEFATGTKKQITDVAQFFGLRYFTENDQILHVLRTAIIGPDGKVRKVYRDNTWKPEDLAREMEKAVM